MAESSEARKARYARHKERMASDAEYAAEHEARQRSARDRYEAKLKEESAEGASLRARRQAAARKFKGKQSAPTQHVSRKPGRLVALCGWEGW